MPPINNFELITTVDLSYKGKDESNPVYHFIYASQLYQTLFAVYAKFNGNMTDNSCEINSISFKLINYKGLLNIGFTGDIKWDPVKNSFDFEVIGGGTKMDDEFIFKAPLKPLCINKGERYPLIFNRLLRPLLGFDDYIRHDSDKSGLMSGIEPPIVSLFDTEFYDRDGIDFYKRIPKPGMDGYDRTAKLVGNRCNTSNVNLHY